MYKESDGYIKKDDDKIPKTAEKHEEMINFLDNLKSDDKDLVKSDTKPLDVLKKDKSDRFFLEPEKKIKKGKNVERNLYRSPQPFSMGKFFLLFFLIAAVVIIIISLFLVSINNFADSDGDGIPDSDDLFPDKNAMIHISINSFKFKNADDYSSDYTLYYRVFELFEYNLENKTYYNFGPMNYSLAYSRLNYSTFSFRDDIVDVADNLSSHDIAIQFFVYDNDNEIQLDVDDDDTNGLTLRYDLVSGTWTGDDSTGISDGSLDGLSGDIDCYVEYILETVYT